MSLSLEPVGPATEEVPVVEETAEAAVEETAEAVAEETTEAVAEETTEAVAVTEPEPVKKKRGRPKAAAKQVAAAPKRAVRMKPPSPASSASDDETPLDRDDMETLLLDYLVKRKQSQQSARRLMWSQLAGLS